MIVFTSLREGVDQVVTLLSQHAPLLQTRSSNLHIPTDATGLILIKSIDVVVP